MLPALPTGIGEVVGRAAEVLDDLERGRLLPVEPIGIDRVHEGHRAPWVGIGRELADDRQRIVEPPVDRDDAGARGLRLEELAGGDPTARQDDDDVDARRRPVCGRGSRRVAGRGADDRTGAGLERLRDRHDHPAVLERARRVLAFHLEVEQRAAHRAAERAGMDERGEALAEAQRWGVRRDREERLEAIHQPGTPAQAAVLRAELAQDLAHPHRSGIHEDRVHHRVPLAEAEAVAQGRQRHRAGDEGLVRRGQDPLAQRLGDRGSPEPFDRHQPATLAGKVVFDLRSRSRRQLLPRRGVAVVAEHEDVREDRARGRRAHRRRDRTS